MQVKETPTHYLLDGVPYLRVTTLLNAMMVDQEYAKHQVDMAAYDEATRLGTQVDKMITDDLLGRAIRYPKVYTYEAKTLWEAYQESKRTDPLGVDGVQELVKDDDLKLAGRIDHAYGMIIRDYKCTAKLLRRAWLQTNTYCYLKFGELATKAIRQLVRLDKQTGMAEIRERPTSCEEWVAVKHMKHAYDLLYGENKEVTNGPVTNAAHGG